MLENHGCLTLDLPGAWTTPFRTATWPAMKAKPHAGPRLPASTGL